jgi:hypothetical protein
MVKDEHKHQAILLHPFLIRDWKWDIVTIDFITKFSIIARQYDSSWKWWKILRRLHILFQSR